MWKGACLKVASVTNPDLGEASPRPPAEGRSAAPQTPLHKGQSVWIGARFALASQWESIGGWGQVSLVLNSSNLLNPN
jgi:hypothetical protein